MKRDLVILLPLVILITSGIIVSLYFMHFNGGYSREQSDWAAFGGYISGTVGVLLSFLAICLLYLTFKDQRKLLFENRYQGMVNNYYSILNMIHENFLHSKKKPNYQDGREIFGNAVGKIEPSNFKNTYTQIYKTHINVFHHHSNYIIGVLNSLYDAPELNQEERNEYVTKFLSQVSVFEIVFISYYIYLDGCTNIAIPNKELLLKTLYPFLTRFSEAKNHQGQIKRIIELTAGMSS